MTIANLDELLRNIVEKKNALIYEIEKEIEYLKEHDISVDININDLRNSITWLETSKKEYLKLRNKLADLEFLNTVEPLIKEIPTSNGTSYFEKIDVNIGIIADEFLYNSFKDVANFHYIHKDHYKDFGDKIDILLIATAWRGLYNEWKGMGNPKISKMRKTIFDMIDFYKQHDVKIVFYSKEDPTNYEYFVDIAEKCDYIFTTAAEKVEDYKKDCKNENVFLLEFGVNPIYNNPIGITSKPIQNGALFAGSWYQKYPERQKDSKILFDGVVNANQNLKILDRNYDLKLEQHFYPTQYLNYISPGVEHEKLQQITKLYEWVINLNTVKSSQSMFANRVYELQAMGNLLLSNYSLGINNYFPNIFFAFDDTEIKYIMQNYSEKERYQHRLFGVRQVLRKHTTFHRINQLLNDIGYKSYSPAEAKKVAVLTNEITEKIEEMFNNQTYKNKSLLTIEDVQKDEALLDDYAYLTFFLHDNFYGEYYLEDMINAFKYTNVSYVTKDSYYKGNEKIQGIENNYIDEIKNKFNTVFSLEKFKVSELLGDIQNLNQKNGYSADSLEFNIDMEVPLETNKDKKFSVIIPTYNNGQHLYGKCFMSLRRSTMFKDMEIIIVDDGSTDRETLLIIDRLKRQYTNIKVFKFNDGGSGSASRPRNKGVELATTEYITFLDPDNEAVNDGYSKLYEALVEDDYDLVIGNMNKFDVKEYEFNYYKDVTYYEGTNAFINTDIKRFLGNTYFKAQSIQALMAKKNIITENNLKMVEKAVGEDTLFFHQLVATASKFKVIDELIHIYYAGVSGSAVNYITKSTFEKYFILEKERMKFLKKHDLLDQYMLKRFNYYFKNWYLKKLEMVHPDSSKDASVILYNIYKMYEDETSKGLINSELQSVMKEFKKVSVIK